MFIGTSGSEEKSSICASYASIDGEADITVAAGEMHRVWEQEQSAFALPFIAELGQAWSVQITWYDTPVPVHRRQQRRRRRQRLTLAVEMATESPHAADVEFLVRRSMTKGYQLFSLLTPPAYMAFVLARKGRAHFSINRFLRATWVGGAVGKLLPTPSVLSFILAQDARLVEGLNMSGPPTPVRSPSEIDTSVAPTMYVLLEPTCVLRSHLPIDRVLAGGRPFHHRCLTLCRPHPRPTFEEGEYDKL